MGCSLGTFHTHEDAVCAPMLDAALATLLEDLDDRGLLKETLVVAVGEFGRSPKTRRQHFRNSNSDDGRDHWPYCYTGVVAGGGMKCGYAHGKLYKQLRPAENPVHPGRTACVDLSCCRTISTSDCAESSQSATRNGQIRRGDGSVRVKIAR